MEILIVIAVYSVVALNGFCKRDKTVELAEPSLCLTCVNSVVTRGTKNEEGIACNFAGAMRAIQFTVSSSSGFRSTATSNTLVTIEGFVRDKREAYAEVAIS